MSRENTQKMQILSYLKTHSGITPLEALHLCGCFRLAAIIWVLRNEGYDIRTDMVDDGDKRYASYRLVVE